MIDMNFSDQKELIHADDWDWIIWLDGGRYDYFEALHPDYLSGSLTKAHNGGVGYTGDWCEAHLARPFEGKALFTAAPISEMEHTGYETERWFDAEIDVHSNTPVHDRLAALGYGEVGDDPHGWVADPLAVNKAVRDNLDRFDGGVVRYFKPHPPFLGLESLTTGSGKATKVLDVMNDGTLTPDGLQAAYERTYRLGLEAAANLLPDLSGRVIITSDHGECLYDPGCGQVFHGRNYEKHDHLVNVPWLEVER